MHRRIAYRESPGSDAPTKTSCNRLRSPRIKIEILARSRPDSVQEPSYSSPRPNRLSPTAMEIVCCHREPGRNAEQVAADTLSDAPGTEPGYRVQRRAFRPQPHDRENSSAAHKIRRQPFSPIRETGDRRTKLATCVSSRE